MLKKTDKPNVYKDTQTGALINKDINRLSAYKNQKRILEEAKTNKQHISEMRETVSELKDDVHKLMSVVEKLTSKMEQ